MTETATPSPSGRGRTWIIVGVAVVAVVAAIVGGYLFAASSADGRASDYDDDYASWLAKDKEVLLAATAKVPTGTFDIKNNVYSSKSRKAQKSGCAAVTEAREDLEAAAGRLPTVGGGGLLGTVSSDYSEAGDRSTEREKTVKAYVADADAALAQIERDCQFNIQINTQGAKASKLFTKSSKYLMKRGDVEANASCTQYDTCVSSIASKKNKYADLRIKATKMYQSGALALWQSDCEATSYAEACGTIAKAYATATKQQLANYQYVRETRTSVDNDGIAAGLRKLNKISERNAKQIKKAVLALDTEAVEDKQVRRSPGWTDNFFAESARVLLSGLQDRREAIDSL